MRKKANTDDKDDMDPLDDDAPGTFSTYPCVAHHECHLGALFRDPGCPDACFVSLFLSDTPMATKKRVKFMWEYVKEFTDHLEDEVNEDDEENLEAFRDMMIRLKVFFILSIALFRRKISSDVTWFMPTSFVFCLLPLHDGHHTGR